MDDFDWRFIKEFKEMERQMGRMLRSMSTSRMLPRHSGSDWLPAVDVYETDKEIYVYMDTAGIDPEKLTVIAEQNSITVSGIRQLPGRNKICKVHQLEIELGAFKRTVSFPVQIDVSATEVSFKNGILEVKIPKEVF